MGRLAEGVAVLVSLVVSHVVSLARTAREAEIRYPAAALAYYAFVSFVPLLLLVFAVVGDRFEVALSRTVPRLLTPEVGRLVDRSLATASGRTGAGVLAGLVLCWSGANVVGDVRTVVDRVEGGEPTGDSLRGWLRDATVVLGGFGLAIAAIVATSALVERPVADPRSGLVGFLLLWGALAAAFLPLYAVPSRLVDSPTSALPGALVASFGWTALHTAIRFYAVHARQYAVYGALSGVVIVLTSLYLAAALLLTGFVVNARGTAGPSGRRP